MLLLAQLVQVKEVSPQLLLPPTHHKPLPQHNITHDHSLPQFNQIWVLSRSTLPSLFYQPGHKLRFYNKLLLQLSKQAWSLPHTKFQGVLHLPPRALSFVKTVSSASGNTRSLPKTGFLPCHTGILKSKLQVNIQSHNLKHLLLTRFSKKGEEQKKSGGLGDFPPQSEEAEHFKVYSSPLLILSPSFPTQEPRSEQV